LCSCFLLVSSIVLFSFRFCWAGQHHGWVLPFLLLWEKPRAVTNLSYWPWPTVRTDKVWGHDELGGKCIKAAVLGCLLGTWYFNIMFCYEHYEYLVSIGAI
jgi:hypothetical protein